MKSKFITPILLVSTLCSCGRSASITPYEAHSLVDNILVSQKAGIKILPQTYEMQYKMEEYLTQDDLIVTTSLNMSFSKPSHYLSITNNIKTERLSFKDKVNFNEKETTLWYYLHNESDLYTVSKSINNVSGSGITPNRETYNPYINMLNVGDEENESPYDIQIENFETVDKAIEVFDNRYEDIIKNYFEYFFNQNSLRFIKDKMENVSFEEEIDIENIQIKQNYTSKEQGNLGYDFSFINKSYNGNSDNVYTKIFRGNYKDNIVCDYREHRIESTIKNDEEITNYECFISNIIDKYSVKIRKPIV